MKTVFSVIEQELQQEIASITLHLQKGGCEDYASYKYCCGQIRGLTDAINQSNDLRDKMENSDDED